MVSFLANNPLACCILSTLCCCNNNTFGTVGQNPRVGCRFHKGPTTTTMAMMASRVIVGAFIILIVITGGTASTTTGTNRFCLCASVCGCVCVCVLMDCFFALAPNTSHHCVRPSEGESSWWYFSPELALKFKSQPMLFETRILLPSSHDFWIRIFRPSPFFSLPTTCHNNKATRKNREITKKGQAFPLPFFASWGALLLSLRCVCFWLFFPPPFP